MSRQEGHIRAIAGLWKSSHDRSTFIPSRDSFLATAQMFFLLLAAQGPSVRRPFHELQTGVCLAFLITLITINTLYACMHSIFSLNAPRLSYSKSMTRGNSRAICLTWHSFLCTWLGVHIFTWLAWHLLIYLTCVRASFWPKERLPPIIFVISG